MKKLLLIIGLCCTSSIIYAQTENKPATQPAELIKVNVTNYDFGKIVQGKPVTYDFLVTNTGTEPLKLDDVHASCGCTTPVWSKEQIAPGATSKINVGFNALAYGPFEKTITITYNNGQTKLLTIKGEVRKTADNSVPGNSILELFKQ
ncbi:MAG: DUF1573 domain-containing protein [Sphingobacteriales bacterium]|nr:DUF1573 domain-containing protein [Sphingobacteriales bacterium]